MCKDHLVALAYIILLVATSRYTKLVLQLEAGGQIFSRYRTFCIKLFAWDPHEVHGKQQYK
jgi:hypothetical protein